MALAKGVLPDDVMRDPRAEALLVACALDQTLDRGGVETWLCEITRLVHELTATAPRRPAVATAAIGFGRSFFLTPEGTPRFGLDGRIPADLQTPPLVAGVADPVAGSLDMLLYVMATSEAQVASFLEGLSHTRTLGLHWVVIERGFQRADGRELFGFRDGLRNVRTSERHGVIFVDRDGAPDEPDWAEDGTYMAYLKVPQDFDAWGQLAVADQEQIIGRRKDDGSRLDLPPGTNPHAEDEIASPPPGMDAHIRKSGPRGALHDRTQIFRRGVPYLTLREDGAVDGGLQFVSFQSSLDQFAVILNRWMANPDFPSTGSRPDGLFARGLATIAKAGFYFVPPHDPRFLGAGMFDPPRPVGHPRKPGRIIIRKRALDVAGNPALAEVGGIGFQLFRADTNAPIGEVFFTDSAGHACSPEVPLRTPLLLREVQPPSHLEPSPDVAVTLTRSRELVRVDNRVRPGQPGYNA